MFVGRIDELSQLRRWIADDSSPRQQTAVINLYGLFGAGKSTLLRRLDRMIAEESLADAVFVTNEDISAASVPEFVFELASGFRAVDDRFARFGPTETERRRRRYLQIVGRLDADRSQLINQIARTRSSETPDAAQASQLDLFSYQAAVDNQFNNPDDQRLLLESGNVMTEAFIVDLMNTFFPAGNKPSGKSIKPPNEPRRLVFLIDTFEKVSELVNPWLIESLLPYFLERRFGDFQNYQTSFVDDSARVCSFFDARFVIAGRERLSLTDRERRWDRYRDVLGEIRIGPFTREELSDFLQRSGFEPERHIDRVYELTLGLPYLAALWVDAARAEQEGAEAAVLASLAEQRILWYKTQEQRAWIRAAAHLKWFDADALACFEDIDGSAERAFEYLRNSSELARPSVEHAGKFELHEIIRQAMQAATGQLGAERADAYRESAAAFADGYELLASYDRRERLILRRLAYFARFDEHALRAFFGAEAHLAADLVERAGGLFESSNGTTSMQSSAAARLRRYNRSADAAEYNGILARLAEIWNERRRELESGIVEHRRKIEELEAVVRQRTADRRRDLEVGQQLQQGISAIETDLRQARRRFSSRLSDREVMVARSSFFFLVVFVILVFAAGALPFDEGTQNLIRTASLALVLLFLVVFSLSLGRILYMRSRRNEQAAVRDDVESVERRLSSRQFEFHDVSSRSQAAASEIEAAVASIERLRLQIEELERRLRQPYV